MEKPFDLMFTHVFKRIIYFNHNCQDVVTKTVKLIKDEILATNSSCDTYEFFVYKDTIRIYCNNESVIKQLERCLIKNLPSNILIYPHYTENPVNFKDIRTFQKHQHLRLGQLIFQAVQVPNLNYLKRFHCGLNTLCL